jgi:hypothetical protein
LVCCVRSLAIGQLAAKILDNTANEMERTVYDHLLRIQETRTAAYHFRRRRKCALCVHACVFVVHPCVVVHMFLCMCAVSTLDALDGEDEDPFDVDDQRRKR